MIDVTLRNLETSKQGARETFSEYMIRWKGKASKMVNRPNEKDQINMIIKNLLPAYNIRLLSSTISSFRELYDCETRIEDAINNGQLEKGESKPPIKRRHVGEDHPMPKPMNVSAIIPQQPLAYQNFLKKTHREFSNLGMTLAQTYENLTSKGFLKPLQPTLMPNPMPFTWNLNEYCHFH